MKSETVFRDHSLRYMTIRAEPNRKQYIELTDSQCIVVVAGRSSSSASFLH